MTRRAPVVVTALALLALTACGGDPGPAAATAPGSSSAASSEASVTSAAPSAEPVDADDELAALEASFGARIGVHAVDTATGRTVDWRGDERFAYASTIKALAAAVVLDRTTDAELDEVVTWTAADLVEYSPVTELHVEAGLPLRDVAAAAITVSDNTAGNLLLAEVGGPAALDAALADLGDDVVQVERTEPDLNTAVPGDPRDTTTPSALAQTLRAVAVDDALEPSDREQLVEWLRGTTTGDALVRAAVPAGWTVGDKTGSAAYGTRNDVAVAWPPNGTAPVVISVMTTHADPEAETDDALVAAAARAAFAALGVA